MTLPEAFIEDIKAYLPASELAPFIQALTDSEPTTSLRYNRAKCAESSGLPIGWNPDDGV
jgi:hypothetical protein